MIAYLTDIWDNFRSVVSYITIVDIVDMIFLSAILFFVIKLMRETRAEQLIKGIVFFAVVLFILQQAGFKVMGIIAETFFNIGILAIIVMFQPELRRILERVGRTRMAKRIPFLEGNVGAEDAKTVNAINSITDACEHLSRTMTGALIVIERQTKLGEQIDTGTIINAEPSAELFGNIFVPNTPLHDGAVIMRDGLIHAAACYLPKPAKEELVPKELGTRHRAAIGISEVSDAIVVVVSEETGIISVVEDGNITRNFSGVTLKKYLTERLIHPSENHQKKNRASKRSSGSKAKEGDKK
ncbi:MAG: diadenylate cyclase CdaA [Oscillospiraceae bacterium]|nr:diadenylate cyclase CdaA [Oscillospiraceae bacterium]